MRNIFYFLILLSLTGCSGIFKKHIINNYYLTASDYSEYDMSLSCIIDNTGGFIETVGPTIIELEYDSNYIVIKQNPRNFPDAPNKEIINYYIVFVKKSNDDGFNNNLVGPLSLSEFNDFKIKLRFDKLKSISIEDIL